MPSIRRAADADDRAGDDGQGSDQQGAGLGKPRHRAREQITFFTVPEVAEHLGVADRTVWRWIEVRQLVAHRFGRAVRISEQDLRRFLAAHRGE
jgi:excisionase family DNA binding protein